MFSIMFLLAVIVISISPVTSTSGESTALKFGDDGYSAISLQPNMSPLTDKFTVCLWFKKLRSGNSPMLYAYEQGEMYLYDYRGDKSLFGVYLSLPNEFITPMRVWTHYCGTWSVASRTYRTYINGKLAAFQITASGRRLKTGGTLVLGDYYDPAVHGKSGLHFGGEMHNLNFFSKESTGSEVAAMSADGLCTPIPEELEQYRAIRWEEVLRLPRRGNVQDIDSVCSEFIGEKETLRLSLNNTQAELLKLQKLFNSSQEELRTVKRNLLSTTEELNSTRIELDETAFELNETRTKLDNSTLKEGECTDEMKEMKRRFLSKADELNATSTELKGTVLALNETRIELKDTALKWNETIMKLENTTVELNETRTELVGTTLKHSGCNEKLDEAQRTFHSKEEELSETKVELKSTALELFEIKAELGETELELVETKLEVKNVSETKCALRKGFLTKWDVFYSCDYYNKTFTLRLYKQLQTTWASLTRRLLGMTMTENLIEIIKDIDEENSCDEV